MTLVNLSTNTEYQSDRINHRTKTTENSEPLISMKRFSNINYKIPKTIITQDHTNKKYATPKDQLKPKTDQKRRTLQLTT